MLGLVSFIQSDNLCLLIHVFSWQTMVYGLFLYFPLSKNGFYIFKELQTDKLRKIFKGECMCPEKPTLLIT